MWGWIRDKGTRNMETDKKLLPKSRHEMKAQTRTMRIGRKN